MCRCPYSRPAIFFLLMYYAHTIKITIYLDTGVEKHRKIVNICAVDKSLGRDY